MNKQLKEAYRRWIFDNFLLHLTDNRFGFDREEARMALRKVKRGVRP